MAYATEGAVTSDNSPSLSQPVILTHRAQGFIRISSELYGDWGAALDQLGREFQRAKDDLEATKFTTGIGTNEPSGILTGATTTAAVSGGAGTFTVPDLAKLEENVPNRFRPRSVIFGNRVVANLAQKFTFQTDATPTAPNANAVWGPRSTDGYDLWNYPFYESTAMASVITTGSKILVMGDPSYFVIIDRNRHGR